MVELFEQHEKKFDRQSSKGNQLKWEDSGVWYKADYCGYEGLSEYVISELLGYSTLSEEEYVKYSLEQIRYKTVCYNGVKSDDFLKDGWQIITVERLYKSFTGESLYQKTWQIDGVGNRLQFFVEQVERITGLTDFGKYINIIFTIDALFVNEDRHMHNIAVLMNQKGEYDYCPIFDNGAGLLSDIKMDYPMDNDVLEMLNEVEARTICSDFDEQLEVSERLYGCNIKFNFTKKDVERVVNAVSIYSDEIKSRVGKIINDRMRKYQYLF